MSTNKPSKPRQVSWFNGCGGRVGVVIAETGESAEHAYIGMALRHDEAADVEHILMYGAKFPLEAALLLPVSRLFQSEG